MKLRVRCTTQEELATTGRRCAELLRGEVILHTRYVLMGTQPPWWAPIWQALDANGSAVSRDGRLPRSAVSAWYRFWRRVATHV